MRQSRTSQEAVRQLIRELTPIGKELMQRIQNDGSGEKMDAKKQTQTVKVKNGGLQSRPFSSL